MTKQVIVTTSWDDGHRLDTRLAALLKKYGVPGTFYVSPHDREFSEADRLGDAEVRRLSKEFEIGAHTMTHPRLRKVPDDVAHREIIESKQYLERLIGKPVRTFCYPGGSFARRHETMARETGFDYARTVRRHNYGFDGMPYAAETTVNTYNHYQDLWKIAKFARFNPRKIHRYFQWEQLAKAMFDRVLERGGVFHLWGHSWEVDGHGDWEKLEDVLRYISGRKDVQYVTNGELADTQPKRLLLAAPYFPPHLGGVEVYSYNMARLLQQKFGWEVCVATSGGWGFGRARRSTYEGISTYHLPYWFKLSNTPVNPWWFISLRRIIKQESVRVVNAHAPVPFLLDAAAWAAGDTPFVATYHTASMQKGGGMFAGLLRFYERRILPRSLERAARIVCASDIVRDGMFKACRGKSVTITPGVDLELYAPTPHVRKQSLLFVSGLEKTNDYKGLGDLLQAIQKLQDTFPDLRLTIVGDGTGRQRFEALAASLGITKQVYFAGGKYGRELARAFTQADVFVLPTHYDNFPLVILEAMAAGLPVVSTRVGAIAHMVDDGQTGYVLDPGDVETLTNKLRHLLEHPQKAKQFGTAGRKKAEQQFGWATQVQKMHHILLASMGAKGDDESTKVS